MARFLLWSDLHCEFRDDIPPVPPAALDVDAVLIAGDIHSKGRHLDVLHRIWDQIRKPLLYVKGNHDYYATVIQEMEAAEEARLRNLQACGIDIRMIEGKTEVIGDTRIIGAVLWTDLNLFPGMHNQTLAAVRDGIKDFSRIDASAGRPFTTEGWIHRHWRDREFILGELSKPHDGPTVVMTHHLPVSRILDQAYCEGPLSGQILNAAYASDMWEDIKALPVDTWICGHSHRCRDISLRTQHGFMRFVSNPMGYPNEYTGFNPATIIDTSSEIG